MLRYCFALMMFLPPYTWGQDGMANNMANITAGEYRPLYLSLDSPLVSVQSFKIDTQPVTNRQFQYFLLQNPKRQRDVVPTLFAENNYLSHWEKSSNLYQPNLSDLDKPVISAFQLTRPRRAQRNFICCLPVVSPISTHAPA